jgi:hypothetical protein
MMKLLSAATVAILLSGGQTVMSNMSQIIKLDTIQGKNFLEIQTALGVIQHHNPDLTHYKITVVREGPTMAVVFTATDGQQASSQVNLGVGLGSQTELSSQDLQILMGKMSQIIVLDTIQGNSFLAIQTAMKVFQRHNPDLTQYKINVVREGSALVIIFADKDRPAGTRGSVGKLGFEVAMNAQDLRVLRSNFVR